MTITKQHLTDLEDVRSILSEVDAELDGSMNTCASCGRDSWADLREGRLAGEVSFMLRKARKCLGLVKDALREREVDAKMKELGEPQPPYRGGTHENP